MGVKSMYKIYVELIDGTKMYLGEHLHYHVDDVWSWMGKVVRKHADYDKVVHTRGLREDQPFYKDVVDADTFYRYCCTSEVPR